MPFAITCPKCATRVQSAEKRPVGEGVQCPTCGEQFAVSADNQEESAAGPIRQSGGRKAVFVILGLVGLLVVGVGAYFLFFSGSDGESAGDLIRPAHDLPTDLFVFRPSDGSSIDIRNAALLRDDAAAAPVNLPPIESTLPTGHGITQAQIEVYCEMSDPKDTSVPRVVALALVDPIDLAAVAGRSRLDPGPRPGMFSKATKSSALVAFQPGPKRLVFVGSNTEAKADLETMARVADRTADLPPPMKEGLALVSGYPTIHASVKPYGDLEYRFTGSYQEKAGIREEFAVRVHNSRAAAKETHAKETKTWDELTAGPQVDRSETTGLRRPFLWVRGDRTFFFDRLPLSKGR